MYFDGNNISMMINNVFKTGVGSVHTLRPNTGCWFKGKPVFSLKYKKTKTKYKQTINK